MNPSYQVSQDKFRYRRAIPGPGYLPSQLIAGDDRPAAPREQGQGPELDRREVDGLAGDRDGIARGIDRDRVQVMPTCRVIPDGFLIGSSQQLSGDLGYIVAIPPGGRSAMHPYRTSPSLEPETELAACEPGLRLAFGVMTFVSAVQVAIALPHSGLPSLQTLFGSACFLTGLAWLRRHGRRVRLSGTRHR